MFIDTHTHLYVEQFDEDRDSVVQECLDAGITKLLLPNIDSSSIESLHQLASSYPDICLPMMGLHPCSVTESFQEELDIAKSWLDKRDYIAIGEIGIDLYWDKSTLPYQVEAFKQQIEWAKELGLPIVIHARDSFDEIFEVLDEVNDERLRGIFHCFTGTIDQAKKVLGYGDFLLGIGGVVTFKNGGLDKTLQEIDLDHLVLETDSPYLAPTPNRGKRNKSPYLTLIVDKLVDIYGKTPAEIGEITSANAVKMFNLK